MLRSFTVISFIVGILFVTKVLVAFTTIINVG